MNSSLADSVRRTIERSGKKPRAWAKEAGISHDTVYRLLRGDDALRTDTRRKLVKAGVPKRALNDL